MSTHFGIVGLWGESRRQLEVRLLDEKVLAQRNAGAEIYGVGNAAFRIRKSLKTKR